jgi:hypothetical protein
VKLEGSFTLENVPDRVVFYLEGPPPGIDILVDSVTISYKVIIFSYNMLESLSFNKKKENSSAPYSVYLLNLIA